MSWSTELLAAHPADVFTPDSPATPHGVVLFLHGYDGVTLRDNVAYTAELNRHGLACVCPIGPLCWWTDRVHVPFDAHVSPLDFLKQQVPEFCREGVKSCAIDINGYDIGPLRMQPSAGC